MTFRNPLRQGSAVLFCTALAACFSGTVGCDVYEDELLRRRDDDDLTTDAARGTTDAGKIGTPADASQPNDTGALDASTPDSASMRDSGTLADTNAPEGTAIDGGAPGIDANIPTPDGASSDVSPDSTLRDANAISDTFDAATDTTLDASTGSRDVDAAPPNGDASDDAPRDGSLGTDSNPSDGNAGGPDVQPDAVPPPPTIRVVRLGDGAMSLSSASAAVFIEERRWDGSRVGSAIALPTAKAGVQQPLTMAGNATSEGALSLSLDGRYLTLAGYAAAPGRAAIATSSDVDRVAATVDASGNVDTTTSLGNVFLGTNVRSAASVDGTSFWIGGESGGVWYSARRRRGHADCCRTRQHPLGGALRRSTLRKLGIVADDQRLHRRKRQADHRHPERDGLGGHAPVGPQPLRLRALRSQYDHRRSRYPVPHR